ncbi:MAG: SufE family protein [Adhaeribacter sp.]
MSIPDIQNRLIEDFAFFDDWMDKYEYLIQQGRHLPLIEERYKTDEHLIKGCQSKVWLHAEYRDGRLYFSADSDAQITKGLVSLVIQVLSGHSPGEIAQADLYFIKAIGLESHLSPTRANGLLAMVRQIRLYAAAIQTQTDTPQAKQP